MRPSEEKFAFVELAKFYLGVNHIPGSPVGIFERSPSDEIICLDMIVNFPECHILEYLRISGQGTGQMRSLRSFAHGVVCVFYNETNHILRDDKYKSITKFIKDWKVQFTK